MVDNIEMPPDIDEWYQVHGDPWGDGHYHDPAFNDDVRIDLPDGGPAHHPEFDIDDPMSRRAHFINSRPVQRARTEAWNYLTGAAIGAGAIAADEARQHLRDLASAARARMAANLASIREKISILRSREEDEDESSHKKSKTDHHLDYHATAKRLAAVTSQRSSILIHVPDGKHVQTKDKVFQFNHLQDGDDHGILDNFLSLFEGLSVGPGEDQRCARTIFVTSIFVSAMWNPSRVKGDNLRMFLVLQKARDHPLNGKVSEVPYLDFVSAAPTVSLRDIGASGSYMTLWEHRQSYNSDNKDDGDRELKYFQIQKSWRPKNALEVGFRAQDFPTVPESNLVYLGAVSDNPEAQGWILGRVRIRYYVH